MFWYPSCIHFPYTREKTMKILILDDETIICRSLALGLKRNGHKTFESSNPAEALRLIEQNDFDLLVFDYKMSLFSGFDLIHLLHNKGFNIPVVILTSQSFKQSELKKIRTHSVRILSKDSALKDIVAAVESFSVYPINH